MKAFLSIVSLPLFLAGCNTMEGAGTDIKHAGESLESAAERHKDCNTPCPANSQHSRSRQY